MYWNIVTLFGLFALNGLPHILCYKFGKIELHFHRKDRNAYTTIPLKVMPHDPDYYESHHKQSNHDNEDNKNSHYSLNNVHHHQSHPSHPPHPPVITDIREPDHEEENEINYKYKEFEYPHEEPPKHLAPTETESKYGWLFKLGFLVLGKFILKVIIIKKIIKFFSIIFFLFFVPAFFATIAKHLALEGGFRRSFNEEKLKDQSMENLSRFIFTAIEGFQKAQNCQKSSEEWSCRLNGMFNKVDAKYPFKGITKYIRKGFGYNFRKINSNFTPTKVEYS